MLKSMNSDIEKGPSSPAITAEYRHPATHNPEPNGLTQEEIETKPWKYIGYRGYTNFIASAHEFYIMRRFSALNIRIALALQDEVSVLEEQLDELDKKFSSREAEDIDNGSFRADDSDRAGLIPLVHAKLKNYNEFMLQQREMSSFPAVRQHDYSGIQNWHFNYSDMAISADEQRYLLYQHDLFSASPSSAKNPIRRLLDVFSQIRIKYFLRRRDQDLPALLTHNQDVVYYTRGKALEKYATIMIIGLGLAMLLVPMWIMYALNDTRDKLAVITAFLVTFLGLVSYVMVAKPFETLVATAAYSAVLVVFLQLGSDATP